MIWQLQESGKTGLGSPTYSFTKPVIIVQQAWIDDVVQHLRTLDTRQIFTLVVYRSARHTPDEDTKRSGSFYTPTDLNASWVLDQEWRAEAGSMVVSGKSIPTTPKMAH